MEDKQFRMVFFRFPQKNYKILFLYETPKKTGLKKKTKNRWVVFFFEKPGFVSTLVSTKEIRCKHK